MQKAIVSVFITLVISVLLFVSCKKDTSYMNDAIITGYDSRDCICCGGLMITFNGETKPYAGNFRLISNIATDFRITENDTYPIYVKVDWKEDTTNICNLILITRIARR